MKIQDLIESRCKHALLLGQLYGSLDTLQLNLCDGTPHDVITHDLAKITDHLRQFINKEYYDIGRN